MSEPLSLTRAKRDPHAFLRRLREAAPAPLFLSGYPDPPPRGERRKARRHVLAQDVDSIDSLGQDALLLHLRDGTRLRTEGVTLGRLVKRLVAAGYRFFKPHKHHAIRIERAGGVVVDREPLPDPAAPRARLSSTPEPPELHPDLSRMEVEIVRDEEGARALRFVDPLAAFDALGVRAELFAAVRHDLALHSSDATCPIGPGATEDRVVKTLAPFTCPPLTRLERPEPDSRYAASVRNEGLLTVGGAAFWRLAMKKEKTRAEKDAWIERHKISNLSVAEAAALFRYKGEPSGATGLRDWIERSTAMKNIIWQVHQWMQWGLIDAIKRVEDDAPDPGQGGDDDWWNQPDDPEDPEEKKPNIRTLWYRYGKDALTGWGIHRETKDDEDFQRFVPYLARTKELFLYNELGFKDRMRRRRGIGAARPHLLVATEKDGMEGLTTLFANRVGGSHLVLSGEPPKITMEYLTRDLVHALQKRGSLEDQEVHVFGLVDFNAAGHNILESVRADLEHYVERLTGTRLAAVHSHNLADPADMPDELVLAERKVQVQYEEKWVYVGGSRVKAKDFSDGAGNVSRLTLVADWFHDHVDDPRFHEKTNVARGLSRETYYGLEIDDHPPTRLKRRFRDIVTELDLLG